MKVLVIPDVHLKPKMFERAAALLKENRAELAVCLMDIADDWGQERNLGLYEETYDAAIRFAKEFKDSLWCYGNHDVSYLLTRWESGYSDFAEMSVRAKIRELQDVLCKDGRLEFIHRIDNVLFMHGGLTESFVKKNIPEEYYDDVDKVLKEINGMRLTELWHEHTPLWLRPQGEGYQMYKQDELLQVVGHTPVRQINKEQNVLSCDTFSTYRDGRHIGTQDYLIIETETWDWTGVR